MKKQLFLFLVFVLFISIGIVVPENKAFASTEVSGIINSNTTWTLANSPYNVTGNVLIAEGVTLTVESGTEINFYDDSFLQVMGELYAIGEPGRLISFSGGKIKVGLSGEYNKGGNIHLAWCNIDRLISIETQVFGDEDWNNFYIDNCILAGISATRPGHHSYLKNSSVTGRSYIYWHSTNNLEIMYNKFQNASFIMGDHIGSKIKFNNNNFIDSTLAVDLTGGNSIDTSNNYWGTTNINEINAMITDYWDDFSLGEIIYAPYASEELPFNGPTPQDEPETCTSFVYSNWGMCNTSNTQTRTIISSFPEGCAGGNPILTQSCTYIPYHEISLEPGWNVVSTPRLVESHEFSAEENLSNFDIYILDPDNLSGWSTMQDLGQTEFTPLFGYFIYNKTGADQTLTLYYSNDVLPNERLFYRDLVPGWNVVGVANPSYALKKNENNSVDTDNVQNILTSLSACIDTILDFTEDQPLKSSVKIGDQWGARVYNDANNLYDFRETKAYAVYLNSNCTYQGFQNVGPIYAQGNVIMDMDKTATPDKEVVIGTDNVVLATLNLTSNGENSTISQIADTGNDDFIISGTGLGCSEVENAELRDINTGTIQDISIASSTTAWTCALSIINEIHLTNGVTKTFQIRLDLKDSTNNNYLSNGDTIMVTIASTALAITGDDSNADLQSEITPGSVSGSIITIENPSLTWTTTSLASQTIIPGTQDVVIYEATLEANDASAITLTSVKIDVDDINYASFHDNNISGLELRLDGKVLTTKSNFISNDGLTNAYVNFTSLNTANRVIAVGDTVSLELVADFSSSFSPTGVFALEVADGDTSIVCRDNDNNAVVETVNNVSTDSRAVNLQNVGTLKVELNTDEIKASADTYILAGNSTTKDRYLAELVFTTVNEPIKVKTLKLDLSDNTGINAKNADVKYVNLYDDDGVLVTQKAPDANGDVNFDVFNMVFPAYQVTSLWVGVTAKTINANGDPEGTATYGRSAQYVLNASAAVTAEGANSGATINMGVASTGTVGINQWDSPVFASSMITTITGSVSNSIVNNMSDAVLVGGNAKIVGKYKFVFDNGNNRATSTNVNTKAQMRQLVLAIATSSTTYLSNIKAYIEGVSSVKTTQAQPVAGAVTINLTTLTGGTGLVNGEVTLVIIGDITTSGTSQYLQTKINNLNGDFTYNGDSGIWPVHFSDARLSISEVIGGTLSN